VTAPRISIRPAVVADASEIAGLEELTLADPWTASMVAGSLGEPSTSAWLAEHEGVAVGYAIFQLAGDELELLRLGVDPAWRRAGIGGELVARGLALGLDRGLSACFLEVRADNAPAQRLYARLGFRQEGARRRYYADGSDAAIYRRTFGARG
jgi:ribosomal-protein-alanine acetyltransferase